MNMCDDGHDEIVYDRNVCPLCSANDEIKELEEEVGELSRELGELKNDYNNLSEKTIG